jgi:hypothetical protein
MGKRVASGCTLVISRRPTAEFPGKVLQTQTLWERRQENP